MGIYGKVNGKKELSIMAKVLYVILIVPSMLVNSVQVSIMETGHIRIQMVSSGAVSG